MKISSFRTIQLHNERTTQRRSSGKTTTSSRSNKRKRKLANATHSEKCMAIHSGLVHRYLQDGITSDTKPEFHISKSDFANTEQEDWNTLRTGPTTKHCLSKNTSQKPVTESPLYAHDSRKKVLIKHPIKKFIFP